MSLAPCAPGHERVVPAPGATALGHLAMAAALLLLVMLCGAPAASPSVVSVLPVASASTETHPAALRTARREAHVAARVSPASEPARGGTLRAPVAARHRQLPPIRAP